MTAAVVAPGGKDFALTSSPGPLGANRIHVIHGGINRTHTLLAHLESDCDLSATTFLLPTYMPAPSQWRTGIVALSVPLTDNIHWQEILNIVIQAATSSGFSGLLVPGLYFWICRNVRMARYQWQEVGDCEIMPGVCVTPNTSKALLSLGLNRRSEQLIPWFNEIYFWC